MKRIELLIKDSLFNDYIDKNLVEEKVTGICKHDLSHHLDVARIAYILVLEPNDLNYFIRENNLSGKLAAKEVIYAAGLLHDIGKWKEYSTGEDHAAFGSRIAREILPRAYFNNNEVDVISRAIFEHSNISRDMSFLGERLHRADNLSRVCSECDQRFSCPKIRQQEVSVTALEY